MKDLEYLSIRTRHTLVLSGIVTVQDIAELTLDDLKRVRNLGMRAYNEILSFMHGQGYDIDGNRFVKQGCKDSCPIDYGDHN